MSVNTVYVVRLTCDGCGKTTDTNEGGAAEIRLAAAAIGWTFIDYKRKHIDICPDCDNSEVIKHQQEIWAARRALLASCALNQGYSGCRLAHNAKWKPPCTCLLEAAGICPDT